MLSIDCRPKKFSEVIGQDLAVATLKSLAATPGIAARSIVLQGSFGCGKSTTARIFAKAVSCENFQKTGDVCLECESCKNVAMNNSPYFMEFDASRIGNVDAIKALVDRLSYVMTDKRRVVVLDECHASSNAALTSLLKVLEEGIDNTFFVFSTTEPLMKTIMSRSCVIPFSTVPSDILHPYVRKVADEHQIQITDDQIDRLVQKSGGHVRNAMQYLDHFSMVGEEAIQTSYALISKIILYSVRNEDIYPLLSELEHFSLVDVKQSLSLFIKNVFMGNGAFEAKLKEKGLVTRIFNIFYSPEVREALNDEYGVLLSFRYFKERLHESR